MSDFHDYNAHCYAAVVLHGVLLSVFLLFPRCFLSFSQVDPQLFRITSTDLITGLISIETVETIVAQLETTPASRISFYFNGMAWTPALMLTGEVEVHYCKLIVLLFFQFPIS